MLTYDKKIIKEHKKKLEKIMPMFSFSNYPDNIIFFLGIENPEKITIWNSASMKPFISWRGIHREIKGDFEHEEFPYSVKKAVLSLVKDGVEKINESTKEIFFANENSEKVEDVQSVAFINSVQDLNLTSLSNFNNFILSLGDTVSNYDIANSILRNISKNKTYLSDKFLLSFVKNKKINKDVRIQALKIIEKNNIADVHKENCLCEILAIAKSLNQKFNSSDLAIRISKNRKKPIRAEELCAIEYYGCPSIEEKKLSYYLPQLKKVKAFYHIEGNLQPMLRFLEGVKVDELIIYFRREDSDFRGENAELFSEFCKKAPSVQITFYLHKWTDGI